MPDDTAAPDRPLERLRVLAKQDVLVTPLLRHIEGFTLEGLLTFLWHGDPQAERVVLMCGGAMGGLLGPADGLYQDLLPRADAFASLRVIGDAEAPGLIAHAIYAGHRAAQELGEAPREVPFRRHLPRFVT